MRSCALMRYYQSFPTAIPLYKVGYPRVTHPSATQSPNRHPEGIVIKCFVRLACVKHAASVHPEPGSNSHVKVCHSWRFRFVPNLLFKGSNQWLDVRQFFRIAWIFSFESFKVFHCSVINVLLCRFCLTATWSFYQIPSCLSTTFFFFFCRFVSISAASFGILSHLFFFVNNFLLAFSLSELYNSMCLANQLMYNSMPYHPCQQLFTFISLSLSKIKRRGWDSNPRALADKRFSRPPRYDHFDTSPY